MPAHSRNFLSPDDRAAIQEAIAEAERQTAGEIRISIRERRSWRERRIDIAGMAAREFHALGMTRTAGRTGVLIFLLLSERSFHILADIGIHQHVPSGIWQEIADRVSALFAAGSYRNGLVEAVHSVGAVLAEHVPPVPGDRNELSNDIAIH